MRKSLAAFFFSLAFATGVPLAFSQETTEPLVGEAEPLEVRVARLERENVELRRSYMQRLPAADGGEANSSESQRILDLERRLDQQTQDYEVLKRDLELRTSNAVELINQSVLDSQVSVDQDTKVAKNDFRNGYLTWESTGKAFQMHIGGRTQLDAVFLQAPNNVAAGLGGSGLRDSMNFRRARFRMEGKMYETMEYKMEYDFMNAFDLPSGDSIEAVAPLDLWWAFKDVPYFQYVRIGNQKEGLGLERIQSSRWLEFMERSFNNDAAYSPYANGFSPGISMLAFNSDQSWSFNTGFYKNTIVPWQFGVSDGDYASTTRLTWMPVYDEASDGRTLLHFGSSLSIRSQSNDIFRQRVRGPLRNGAASHIPAYLNTGVLNAGTQTIFNQEMAAVLGPWQISGEYYWSFTQDAQPVSGAPVLGEYTTQGGYVQALYFLTGEHRAWDRQSNTFTRVVPFTNAWWLRSADGSTTSGSGAWQVGARYQYQNFPQFISGGNGFGGQLHGVDVVLNWWMNPNTHMVFDYSFVHRNVPGTAFDGPVHGFGTRFAFDF
jgi:phosphate-selective porin OprO and OprP